jgi:predicted transcriptional regulator
MLEDRLDRPRLSKLEFKIMERLWARDQASIREIQEDFPEKSRPSYTTVQNTMYRMEAKGVLRRVKKVGNFHVFAPLVSPEDAQLRLVDELLGIFGGRSQLIVMHLVKSGKLCLKDVREAERELKKLEKKE